MCCRMPSNYHWETTVPSFSFLIKHEGLKSKRIRFVKNLQPSIAFFVVYICYFEEAFFKKWQKSKRERESSIEKLVKICAEYLPI